MRCLMAGFIAAAVIASAGSASATVIDFDGVPVINPSPYSEYGYTVTTTRGNWVGAYLIGNPTPAINDITKGSAVLRVNRTDDGLFNFESLQVDPYLPAGKSVTVTLKGYVGSTSSPAVFSETDTLTTTGLGVDFTTLHASGQDSSIPINYLRVVVDNGSSGLFHAVYIDNINVVPEPAAILVMGAGLVGLAMIRRKARPGG